MKARNSNIWALLTLLVASSMFGIAYTRVGDLREARSLEQCKLNQKRLQTVLDAYCYMNAPEVMPPKLDCLVPLFLKELPRCPSDPRLDYQYFRIGNRDFVLACPGQHKQTEWGYPRTITHIDATQDSQHDFEVNFNYGDLKIPPGHLLPKNTPGEIESWGHGYPFKLNSYSGRGEAVPPEFQHIVDDPSVPRAPNP